MEIMFNFGSLSKEYLYHITLNGEAIYDNNKIEKTKNIICAAGKHTLTATVNNKPENKFKTVYIILAVLFFPITILLTFLMMMINDFFDRETEQSTNYYLAERRYEFFLDSDTEIKIGTKPSYKINLPYLDINLKVNGIVQTPAQAKNILNQDEVKAVYFKDIKNSSVVVAIFTILLGIGFLLIHKDLLGGILYLSIMGLLLFFILKSIIKKFAKMHKSIHIQREEEE